jgi:hypothetical protein
MVEDNSMESQLDLDVLLQNVAYWLEHSNSDVTWPFVKRGLNQLIGDLRQKLELRSDQPAIEAVIAKIEEFIKRREPQ